MLHVAHVGDTRCYLLRAGQLMRLTTDHTMAQRQLDATDEPVDAASELHDVLWNALGGSSELPEPQIVKLTLVANDRLLLCSDGLTKHVGDADILATLRSGANMDVCERLVGLSNAAGGSDNVTVIVADARAAADVTYPLAGSAATELGRPSSDSAHPLQSA
jgi:protein phosphatase